MATEKVSKLQELLQEAGLSVRSYSGRGMIGDDECVGVTCKNVQELVSDVLDYYSRCSPPPDELKEFSTQLRKMRTDSMGKYDTIAYWPRVAYVDPDQDKFDVEACQGCGSLPGEGFGDDCEDEDGCGHWRQQALEADRARRANEAADELRSKMDDARTVSWRETS